MYQQFFKKISKFIFLPLLVLTLFFSGKNANALTCNDSAAGGTAPNPIEIICPIARAVNVLLLSAGVVFTIMIIFSAYKFYTSFGDPKAAMGAQGSLTSAVLGLVLIMLSYTFFVLIVNALGVTGKATVNPFEAVQDGICNIIVCSADKPLIKNVPGCPSSCPI